MSLRMQQAWHADLDRGAAVGARDTGVALVHVVALLVDRLVVVAALICATW